MFIDPLPEPGSPELPRICNPATEPTKASATFVVICLESSSEFTTAADPVNADFLPFQKLRPSPRQAPLHQTLGLF